MVWKKNVLRIKAEKFELMKLDATSLNNERVLALEPLLQDVYASMRPKSDDYDVRRRLVQVFNMIAKEIYGKSKDIPVVVEFGSFVMDLFTISSDLDLSVNFSSTAEDFPRDKKVQTLRKFASMLYAMQRRGHVYGVLPVTSAKVPILKCVDRGTGVECDISVENRDGILKSHIIRSIAAIDERFQKLSFLMKIWAKSHNINSSRDKTLNSLSIILLVAFHLQTRKPPILPPFCVIFKDGIDPETVAKSASSFSNYGKKNEESLAHLFITLLLKLSSVEKLWPKGLCVSNCTASWKSIAWDTKVCCISVEDFMDQFQNVARAVGQAEVKEIYKCINISIDHIVSFLSGQLGSELKELLFGSAVPGDIPNPFFSQRTRRFGTKKRRNIVVKQKKGDNRSLYIEPIRAKSIRTCDGRKWMVDKCWEGTKKNNVTGWEATQDLGAIGWKQAKEPCSWAWGGGWKKKNFTSGIWEPNNELRTGGSRI